MKNHLTTLPCYRCGGSGKIIQGEWPVLHRSAKNNLTFPG